MKKLSLIFVACVTTIVSVFAQTPEASQIPDLRGAWKQIEEKSISVNGKPLKIEHSTIKLITEDKFMWSSSRKGPSSYMGDINGSVAGSYTFDGKTLTETLTSGMKLSQYNEAEKKVVSEITVEGNRMLRKTKGYQGVEVVEEWERINYESQAPDIQGAWKQIEQNGLSVESTYTLIEMIVDGRFMWMMSGNMDGDVFVTAEGSYEFDGKTFTETIMSGFYSSSVGGNYISEITIEGNRMYKKMDLDGVETTEVWEKMGPVQNTITQEIDKSSWHDVISDDTFVWNPDKILVCVPGMELEFRLPQEKDPSGVANLLFRNSQSGEVQLLDTIIDGRRRYRPLEPGIYDAILLYNSGKYVMYDRLGLRGSLNRIIDIGSFGSTHPADDDSRRWLSMRKFTSPIGGERKTTRFGKSPSSQDRTLGYLLYNTGEVARYSLNGHTTGPYNIEYYRRPPIFLSDDGYFEFEDENDWLLQISYSSDLYDSRDIKIEPSTGLFIMMDDAPVTEGKHAIIIGAESVMRYW